MTSDIVLVLLYAKPNRYSFNALVGALETRREFADLVIHFPEDNTGLFGAVSSEIARKKKVVVGVSFSTPQLWQVRDLMLTMRGQFVKQVLFIAGGPHPTADPRGTLRLGFDIVARGEGEETLPELLQVIAAGNGYGSVRGIAFVDSTDEMRSTGVRKQVNLDDDDDVIIRVTTFDKIERIRQFDRDLGDAMIEHVLKTNRDVELVGRATRLKSRLAETEG